MRNKKNFTILGIGAINTIASLVAVGSLSKRVPINIFKEVAKDKMCSKNLLLILPAVVLVMCIGQVIYRLKTMDKTVTKGKRIEDALFTFITGILLVINWSLIHIGYNYTISPVVNSQLPIAYFITAIIGVAMVTIYSAYPINKFGSIIGLRTKETLADEEVWRIANRFNAFTGFVASLIVIGLSVYFALVGFNVGYLVVGLIFAAALTFYVPVVYAKHVAKRKAERVIE